MKIGLAQLASQYANIDANITRHLTFVEVAARQQVDLLLFPELSLTQYDLTLADSSATTADDPRWQRLQQAADAHQMTLGAGAPLRGAAGNHIAKLNVPPNSWVWHNCSPRGHIGHVGCRGAMHCAPTDLPCKNTTSFLLFFALLAFSARLAFSALSAVMLYLSTSA